MKSILIVLLFLTCCLGGNISAQEKMGDKKVTDPKKIDIRSNSRQQSVVKRDNFHQRRDVRLFQMNRMMKNSKMQRRNGKATLLKNNELGRRNKKERSNKQLQQKKMQQQKLRRLQRKQALKKRLNRR